jgi:hypothetical protein
MMTATMNKIDSFDGAGLLDWKIADGDSDCLVGQFWQLLKSAIRTEQATTTRSHVKAERKSNLHTHKELIGRKAHTLKSGPATFLQIRISHSDHPYCAKSEIKAADPSGIHEDVNSKRRQM